MTFGARSARFWGLVGAIALAAACTPAPNRPAAGLKTSVGPAAASTKPSADASAEASPSAAPAASPSAAAIAAASVAPLAAASAAPSPSPTPYTGEPGLDLPSAYAADRPNAIVNYDTAEILWAPADAALTWEVKGLGAIKLGKARVTLGTSTTLDGVAGYRLLQEVPLPSNPPGGPSLDPNFIPPTSAPAPSPLASMEAFDPGGGTQLDTFEVPLDQLGLPAALAHGEARTVTLKLAIPQIEAFIKTRKPVSAVDVEIVLVQPDNAPVLDPVRPALLSGRIQIK